ncbi:MAG: ATP-binding protein, partial [Acidobacteria bacterium]|nr:ATP-binding protein [Acidobacteriota bacterium]
FRDLTITPLKKANLLLGRNDTGKTSVLEGLYLLLTDKPEQIKSAAYAFRSNQAGGQAGHMADDHENFWMWMFHEQDPNLELRIAAKQDSGKEISLRLGEMVNTQAGSPPGHYSAMRKLGQQEAQAFYFDSTNIVGSANTLGHLPKVNGLGVRPTNPVQDAELYNLASLQKNGEKKMEDLMRKVEPRLQRLRYSKLPGCTTPLVYADLGMNSAIPSTQMGQGFTRIPHIYSQILASKAEVFLIVNLKTEFITRFCLFFGKVFWH